MLTGIASHPYTHMHYSQHTSIDRELWAALGGGVWGGEGSGEGTGEEGGGGRKGRGGERGRGGEEVGKGRREKGGEGGRERRRLRREEGKAGRAWELREQHARSLVLRSLWGPCWYSTRWWDTCPGHLPGEQPGQPPAPHPPIPHPLPGSWPHPGGPAGSAPCSSLSAPRSAQRGRDTGTGTPHSKQSRTQLRCTAGSRAAEQQAGPCKAPGHLFPIRAMASLPLLHSPYCWSAPWEAPRVSHRPPNGLASLLSCALQPCLNQAT